MKYFQISQGLNKGKSAAMTEKCECAVNGLIDLSRQDGKGSH